jgi:hypothetical protein
VQLNLPVQGVTDRQKPYQPFFEWGGEFRSDNGPLLMVVFQRYASVSGDHNPGDPSVFLQPNTRGWYCPAPYNVAACVWLGR